MGGAKKNVKKLDEIADWNLDRHIKNELILKNNKHTLNFNRELSILFDFFGINPKKDKLALDIFLELISTSFNTPNDLKIRGKYEGIKSMDIVKNFGVTQAAVVYHLNNFIKKGFVIKEGVHYRLIGGNLKNTVEEVGFSFMRKLDKVKKIAKRVDDFL